MPDNRRGAARPGHSKKEAYVTEKRERASSRLAATLPDLSEKCGDYGEAAVARAQWQAVTVWLMKEGYDACKTEDPMDAASFCSQLVLWQAGLPHPEPGCAIADPTAGLSHEEMEALQATGAAVFAQWRAAGEPHLHERAITREHQYFIAARRAAGHAI